MSSCLQVVSASALLLARTRVTHCGRQSCIPGLRALTVGQNEIQSSNSRIPAHRHPEGPLWVSKWLFRPRGGVLFEPHSFHLSLQDPPLSYLNAFQASSGYTILQFCSAQLCFKNWRRLANSQWLQRTQTYIILTTHCMVFIRGPLLVFWTFCWRRSLGTISRLPSRQESDQISPP